jgi:hypothetical protein
MVDDGDGVGEVIGFFELLGGQQERGALGHQAAQERPQLQPRGRVQASARLVQEQDPGLAHQARPDVETAAHAAGIGPHGPVRGLGERQPFQHLR